MHSDKSGAVQSTFITIVFSVKIPICTSIKFISVWQTCDTNEVFFSYTLSLHVTIDPTNATFPNKVTLSNFSSWSIDPTSYYPDTPATFWCWNCWNSGGYTQKDIPQWDLSTSSYIFNYPNNVGDFNFDLSDADLDGDPNFQYPSIFIDNAEIFYYSNFGLFTPEHSCSTSDFQDTCDDDGPKNNQSICCNTFVEIDAITIDIPDSAIDSDICEKYESETTINSESGDFIASLNATFDVIIKGLNISVTNFKSLYDGTYNFGSMLGNTLCIGNNTNAVSNCIFTFPTNDFRFDMLFRFDKYSTIATKLIRRNEMFLKEGNILFTKSDSCWNLTSIIPFGIGAVFNTKFCCTNFKNNSTRNPATINPGKKCLKYSSKTSVSDNSTFLRVYYTFNATGLVVDINDFKSSTPSNNVQLEAYSKDLFSQTCSASTSTPKNTCIFKLSDTHKYELQMRTSVLPEGFNLLEITEANQQFVTPVLTPLQLCYNETNSYNYVNSQLNATTQFCCETFN